MEMKKFLEDNYIIICDTNVYLNIYRYSPEFTEFALTCLTAVKDNMVITPTVDLEYRKHRKAEYNAMKNRVKKASGRIKSQVYSAKSKIINSCTFLKMLQYPDIEVLEDLLKSKIDDIEKNIDDFFEDRSVLEQIVDTWGDEDLVYNIFESIAGRQSLLPFSQAELYAICEEGESRYDKSIPPGFEDAKNKDGIRKYSDLILWKEVVKYAKEEKLNVIFVTDDNKKDWWENETTLCTSLIEEFKAETCMEIIALKSSGLYNEISKAYEIEKTDAIEIALRVTDQAYFERIKDKVFEEIYDDIAYSGQTLIDTHSAHIGTEGIDELEIIDHSFIDAVQIERNGNEIVYQFAYYVEVEGTSFEYWGRDDDTKQIILSPGAYHKLGGNIIVEVIREIETFIDYAEDSEFETVQILSGDMQELEYENYFERDYYEEGYTVCPDCGQAINSDNDGMNGFCSACAPNH